MVGLIKEEGTFQINEVRKEFIIYELHQYLYYDIVLQCYCEISLSFVPLSLYLSRRMRGMARYGTTEFFVRKVALLLYVHHI